MNWAFLGYGKIAWQFHDSLKEFPDEKVYAIATRSNAEQMRSEYPDAVIYDNYDDLYADEQIDIVYINTTHNFHCEQVIKCLESGKHVLCEKPIGVNYAEVERMVETSRRTGKYLLEGMWTQYLPAYKEVNAMISRGDIGRVHFIKSDFSVLFPYEPENRMYNPKLSGGSIFDLGVYNVALVNDIFKKNPESIQVTGAWTETGVDAYVGTGLHYSDQQTAQIFSGMNATTTWEAQVFGEKGWIRMHEFFRCQKYEYRIGDGEVIEVETPYRNTGFYHEIEATIEHIRNEEIESNIFTHQKSLDSARLVEDILNKLKEEK